jgi:hypothetical protein
MRLVAERNWDVEFPVDSLREAAPHLRRPFTRAAVKWKLQSTWPRGGLVVAYIDARLVVERLNLVVPHLWHEETITVGNGLLLCKLTVDGVTHEDVGQGQAKGLYSDALKRAAVRFGIGVSIYALPQVRLQIGDADGDLRVQERKGKREPVLDSRTINVLRERYENWLDSGGTKNFGPALDHGDAEDAQGTEADEAPAEVQEDAVPLLDDERSNELRDEIKAAFDAVKKVDSKRLLPGQFHQRLMEAGTSHEALEALRDELVEMAGAVAA